MIAQQVKANGAAVAQLTMQHFDHNIQSDGEEDGSAIFEEAETFHNVFAADKGASKPESSKARRPPPKTSKKEALPRQAILKMHFPTFYGTNPRIGKISVRAILISVSYLKNVDYCSHIAL
jgi:hypothetical protein